MRVSDRSMLCPRCMAECPPESRFCLKCGSELKPEEGLRCPSCSTPLPLHARFCLSCGTPVVQEPPREGVVGSSPEITPTGREVLPQSLQRLLPAQYIQKLVASRGSVGGERRVVTILFSDVKGSTALAEHLDPEEVLEIMNGAFHVLIEPITRYEGTLARLMGDAIMAFFGAPISHEDDPARACYAALDIVEGARQYAATLERERGVRGFNVRVGLNTGLVVVAEVGSDLRVEYTAMGDAVNLAARMETAAEPGTVLLTRATLDHIGYIFETQPVGPIQVKGKSEPVDAYRLLRPRAVTADAGSDDGGRSPMIGRDEELASVRSRLPVLGKGTGGIVCISGPMGTGKSRLLQEVRASTATLAWARTRSYAYAEGMSYGTLRQLLLHLAAGRGATAPGNAAVGSEASPAEERPGHVAGPYLEIVLGTSRASQTARSREEHYPEEILPRVIQELQGLLRAEAAERPLVLVWEDLQWIDPSSLIVLESILPLVDEVPILFILLFRADGERMALLGRRVSESFPDCSLHVSLSQLDRAGSALLLEDLLAGRNVPRDIREKILDRSEGNPLFLKEISRQLTEPGKDGEGTAAGVRIPDDGSFSLPDSLRGVIMSRVDGLSSTDRQVLQTASVFGRSFQPALLKEILPESVSADDIPPALKELVRREFLSRQPSPPGSAWNETYSFAHSLTHEVVHESMLLTQRKELHSRAAGVVRMTYQGDPASLAEILAVHYEIAGEKDEAFQCLMEAGERARSLHAHLEAINYYRRALKLATDMGITGAMLRNLYEGLGDVYTIAAKYPAAHDQYDKALVLPQNIRRRAALHRKKGVVHEKSGKYDEAVQSFKEGLGILQSTIDLAESARMYAGLSRVHYLQGKYQAAIELCTLAQEIVVRQGDSWELAHACNTLGLAYMKVGERERASEQFQQALTIWQELGDSYGLSSTYNNLGQYYHMLGDYGEAATAFKRSIELCRQTGNRHGLASAYDNLGQSLAHDGKSEEATGYLAKAVAILMDIDSENADRVPELWQRTEIW